MSDAKITPMQGKAEPQPSATGLTPDLAKVLQEVMDLKQKINDQAKATAQAKPAVQVKPEIDWTKISEKDIIDMSIDIPVIEQDTPEYMNVVLKDKNYIPRWINKLPQRLGTCLATGYTYVTMEDFDSSYTPLLAFDTSGNYSCGDVVCLKIAKSRYYPAIKANYMKTMSIHGRKVLNKAVASGKTSVQLNRLGEEIKTNETVPESIETSRFSLYDPGDQPAPGEKVWTKDMVSDISV